MKKILIIEDDALLADIYRDNFELEGFAPEIASDGDVAIQRLKSNPPDVIISDLMLPSVNGVEVLKFIRSQESTRSIPFLVMSNAYASSLGQEATKAGATKCLAKNSCGPKRLVEEVRSILSGEGAQPAAAAAAPAAAAVPAMAGALAGATSAFPPVAPVAPVAPAAPPKPVAPAAPRPAAPSAPAAPGPKPVSAVTSTGSSPIPVSALISATAVASPEQGKGQADVRRELTLKLPEKLSELRQLLQNLGKSDDNTKPGCLLEFYRAIHTLAGGASFAGLTRIALLSCALETLLKELHSKPKKLNPSSMRTLAQAIDTLGILASRIKESQEEAIHSPLVLVVDDEPISREMTCTALEQAHLRSINLEDPAIALKLAEENRFDLIFLDVQMPGMNGFEVCQKLHTTAANSKTPVVFVTALNDFETRSRSTLSGGVDFIAKPILMIELAVKAMTHLLRSTEKVI